MNVPLSRELRNRLRREEAEALRAKILARTRALMASGHFRPNATEICGQGDEHHIGNRFGGLSSLYELALDDDTARAIVVKVAPEVTDQLATADLHRIARAAVFGRLST